jgi:hypothetical protein
MYSFAENLPLLEVRIVEEILDFLVRGTDWNSVFNCDFGPFGQRLAVKDALQFPAQPLIGDREVDGRVILTFLYEQIGSFGGAAKSFEENVLDAAEEYKFPVLRFVESIPRLSPSSVSTRHAFEFCNAMSIKLVNCAVPGGSDHGVGGGYVDEASVAGARSMDERRSNVKRAIDSSARCSFAAHVHAPTRFGGGLVDLSILHLERDCAGQRIHHLAVRWDRRVRPAGAVTGALTIDDVGLTAALRFVSDPQAIHRSRNHSVDEHVSGPEQFPEQFLAGWKSQVEGHTALILIDLDVSGAVMGRYLAKEISEIVSALWVLDLYNVRAMIAKQRADVVAIEKHREFEDPDTFEQTTHRSETPAFTFNL